jgi:hypothetical protein
MTEFEREQSPMNEFSEFITGAMQVGVLYHAGRQVRIQCIEGVSIISFNIPRKVLSSGNIVGEDSTGAV